MELVFSNFSTSLCEATFFGFFSETKSYAVTFLELVKNLFKFKYFMFKVCNVIVELLRTCIFKVLVNTNIGGIGRRAFSFALVHTIILRRAFSISHSPHFIFQLSLWHRATGDVLPTFTLHTCE